MQTRATATCWVNVDEDTADDLRSVYKVGSKGLLPLKVQVQVEGKAVTM